MRDGGPRRDTGPGPDPDLPDTGVPEPPPGPVLCGGVTCAPGQECCIETGACFDAADPMACRTPPRDVDPRACFSNRDCGPDGSCEVGPTRVCFGAVGECVPRPACTTDGTDPVCGCDGRTYRNPCEAQRAGVRAIRRAACGTIIHTDNSACDREHGCRPGFTCDIDLERCIPDVALYACGTDAQCRAGLTCCELAGICVDPACPECCVVPPPMTDIPCRDDTQCEPLGGYPDTDFFCWGEGCGPGGGCIQPHGDTCSGELAPVCGCDGRDYTNACWARLASTRVAHDGECAP